MRSRDGQLRCCVHAVLHPTETGGLTGCDQDTDQEYTDHAARLAFIGPPDWLDFHFFQPPDVPAQQSWRLSLTSVAAQPTYKGPEGPRRSTRDTVHSMGKQWKLPMLPGAYGTIERNQPNAKLPALFLPHGSPPIPIEPCKSQVGGASATHVNCWVQDWLQQAAALLPSQPSAILFMSPHFVRSGFCVSACRGEILLTATPQTDHCCVLAPATIMDFDDDTDPDKLAKLEKLRYKCPGSPALAHRVSALLGSAGLHCTVSDSRGLDHGSGLISSS